MVVVALTPENRRCAGHVIEIDSVVEEYEVGHCRWCGAPAWPNELREEVERSIEKLGGVAAVDRSRSN